MEFKFSPSLLSNLIHWQCCPTAAFKGHEVLWIRPAKSGISYITCGRRETPPSFF